MVRFDGRAMALKRALITGSSGGLGAALAAELQRLGWEIAGIDISSDTTSGLCFTVDLADRDGLDAALPAIAAAGPWDAVFLNAGISATGPFESIPPEAHVRVLRVNAESAMVVAQALIAADALRGPLCFISSLSHFTGYPGAASYAASKDAITAYAASLRRSGISACVAFPGPLDTPHAARHAPDGTRADLRMAPEAAAKLIASGALAGKARIVPGSQNKFAALAGRLAPGLLTGFMRRNIFERLKTPVF